MDIQIYVALIALGVIVIGFALSAVLAAADVREHRPKTTTSRYRYITIDDSDAYRIGIYEAAAGADARQRRDDSG